MYCFQSVHKEISVKSEIKQFVDKYTTFACANQFVPEDFFTDDAIFDSDGVRVRTFISIELVCFLFHLSN